MFPVTLFFNLQPDSHNHSRVHMGQTKLPILTKSNQILQPKSSKKLQTSTSMFAGKIRKNKGIKSYE